MDVRIVTLPPMRVASARATGPQPEYPAFKKLLDWAKPRDLLIGARVFGFNNPSPAVEGEDYGYEVWLTIEADVQPEDEINVRQFEGGLYAVLSVTGAENIGDAWLRLNDWLKTSGRKLGSHQWLEEQTGPLEVPPEQLKLDLYLPLAA